MLHLEEKAGVEVLTRSELENRVLMLTLEYKKLREANRALATRNTSLDAHIRELASNPTQARLARLINERDVWQTRCASREVLLERYRAELDLLSEANLNLLTGSRGVPLPVEVANLHALLSSQCDQVRLLQEEIVLLKQGLVG